LLSNERLYATKQVPSSNAHNDGRSTKEDLDTWKNITANPELKNRAETSSMQTRRALAVTTTSGSFGTREADDSSFFTMMDKTFGSSYPGKQRFFCSQLFSLLKPSDKIEDTATTNCGETTSFAGAHRMNSIV
jgi:hypothetical protein